jgi:hypothetical protein
MCGMSDARRSEEPVDRLTRLADAAIKATEGHPEHHEDDKVIVFLDDGKRAGLVLGGYEDDTEAMVDLLMHIKAIFEANGKDLLFTTLGQG